MRIRCSDVKCGLFPSIFQALQLRSGSWYRAVGLHTGRAPQTSARAAHELQDVCHPPLDPHRPLQKGCIHVFTADECEHMFLSDLLLTSQDIDALSSDVAKKSCDFSVEATAGRNRLVRLMLQAGSSGGTSCLI